MRSKGIKIWAEDGQLHYAAPRGALLAADVAILRTLKCEIIAFLQRSRPSAAPDEPLVPRSSADKVPLAVIQRFFWRFITQNAGRSVRPPVLIKRLAGHFDIAALEQALTELIRRHEILRTNIALDHGAPLQNIRETSEIKLERIRPTGGSAAEREQNASLIIKELSEDRIDPLLDPLFKPGLIVLGEEDHIFFVLMDHILFDGSSAPLLHRDLAALFIQAAQRRPSFLPELPIQFADYALWQQRTRASRIDVHDAFWSARLAGAQHVRVFADPDARAERSSLVRHPVRFESYLTTALRGFSAERSTTLMMAVLTAYIALLSRWCNRADLVVSVPIVARRHPLVENVIGPFGSLLFLRVVIFEQESFGDLLLRVSDEYNTAYEHDDSGKLAVTMPTPEFVSNASFNFISRNYSTLPMPSWSDAAPRGNVLQDVPFHFDRELDGIDYGTVEPALTLAERQDDVIGFLAYRSELATANSVQRFLKYLQRFAWTLAHKPDRRLPQIK
jgi:hypothetical protein